MVDTTSHLIHVRDSRNGQIRFVPRSHLTVLRDEYSTWSEISEEEARADVRYVRNAAGAVHSIPSANLADTLAVEGTTQVDEDEARRDAPELFGAAS